MMSRMRKAFCCSISSAVMTETVPATSWIELGLRVAVEVTASSCVARGAFSSVSVGVVSCACAAVMAAKEVVAIRSVKRRKERDRCPVIVAISSPGMRVKAFLAGPRFIPCGSGWLGCLRSNTGFCRRFSLDQDELVAAGQTKPIKLLAVTDDDFLSTLKNLRAVESGYGACPRQMDDFVVDGGRHVKSAAPAHPHMRMTRSITKKISPQPIFAIHSR